MHHCKKKCKKLYIHQATNSYILIATLACPTCTSTNTTIKLKIKKAILKIESNALILPSQNPIHTEFIFKFSFSCSRI